MSEQTTEKLAGRYRLEGAFRPIGGVERACGRDEQTKRRVELIRPRTRDAAEPLSSAITLCAKLQHSGVQPLLDARSEEQPFAVFAQTDGERLTEILTRLGNGQGSQATCPDQRQMLLGFLQVCDAVAAAHELGFQHTRLSPACLCVRPTGSMTVTDWWAASESGRATGLDEADNFSVLRCTAPEALQGQRCPASDVYSLGAILYHIIAWRPAISGTAKQEIEAAIRSGSIADPNLYSADRALAAEASKAARRSVDMNRHFTSDKQIPTRLVQATMQALAPLPDGRQSAAKLQQQIQAYLSDNRDERPAAHASRDVYFYKVRIRALAVVLTGVLVVAGVGLGITVREAFRLQAQRDAAREEAFQRDKQIEGLRKKIEEQKSAPKPRVDERLWDQASESSKIWTTAKGILNSEVRYAEDEQSSPSRAWFELGRLSYLELQPQDAVRYFEAAFNYSAPDDYRFRTMIQRYQRACANLEQFLAQETARQTIDRAKIDEDVAAALEDDPMVRQLRAVAEQLQADNPGATIPAQFFKIGAEVIHISLPNVKELRHVDALGQLPLAELSLANTSVSDLSALNLSHVSVLDVSGCERLTALPHLPALERLDMGNSGVSNLAILATAPKLKELFLDHTPVDDLSALKNLPIEVISLSNTRVTELSALSGKPIRQLAASNTQVADLAPLKGAPLSTLALDQTRITDLSPLQGAPLTRLSLRGTAVASLAPLAGMPLRDLFLADCTQIHTLDVLLTCESLQRLALPPSPDETVRNLRELPKLNYVDQVDGTTKAVQFWQTFRP